MLTELPEMVTVFERFFSLNTAVYKSGTGTRGWGHGDACIGTWDLGTRDEGLDDIKYGTRGRVGRGRGDFKHRDAGDAGRIMIIGKVGGKCDISHFPREYVLVKATHPALLRVPPCLFTKRRLGEDPLH